MYCYFSIQTGYAFGAPVLTQVPHSLPIGSKFLISMYRVRDEKQISRVRMALSCSEWRENAAGRDSGSRCYCP
jgi:hypothetical protein